MKLRIFKSQMNKALLWYTNKLHETYTGQFLTPATVELIQRDLESLQNFMQKRETNLIWQVPVGILFDTTLNIFEVVVTDEQNILYIHE